MNQSMYICNDPIILFRSIPWDRASESCCPFLTRTNFYLLFYWSSFRGISCDSTTCVGFVGSGSGVGFINSACWTYSVYILNIRQQQQQQQQPILERLEVERMTTHDKERDRQGDRRGNRFSYVRTYPHPNRLRLDTKVVRARESMCVVG